LHKFHAEALSDTQTHNTVDAVNAVGRAAGFRAAKMGGDVIEHCESENTYLAVDQHAPIDAKPCDRDPRRVKEWAPRFCCHVEVLHFVDLRH